MHFDMKVQLKRQIVKLHSFFMHTIFFYFKEINFRFKFYLYISRSKGLGILKKFIKFVTTTFGL